MVAALSSLCICGCSSKQSNIVPVHGKVVLDGQPLTHGTISTLPAAGRGGRAFIQKDGSFQLGTYGLNDGASIGIHEAAVSVTDTSNETSPEASAGRSLIPARYTNPKTSGLTIEVSAEGPNNPELVLSSH